MSAYVDIGEPRPDDVAAEPARVNPFNGQASGCSVRAHPQRRKRWNAERTMIWFRPTKTGV